jgi:hypothetical protein
MSGMQHVSDENSHSELIAYSAWLQAATAAAGSKKTFGEAIKAAGRTILDTRLAQAESGGNRADVEAALLARKAWGALDPPGSATIGAWIRRGSVPPDPATLERNPGLKGHPLTREALVAAVATLVPTMPETFGRGGSFGEALRSAAALKQRREIEGAAHGTQNIRSKVKTHQNEGHIAGDAYRNALTHLVSLQYPWGEWSDRRTELESRIAERQPRSSMDVPKPNVARTLFSLEAISSETSELMRESRRRAVQWMSEGLRDGWYWEWHAIATPHSESTWSDLEKRPDVRHTAQVVVAIARWGDASSQVGPMIQSLTDCSHPAPGLWPDSPGGAAPRVLATVYAIEALASLVSPRFDVGIDALLAAPEAAAARRALGEGIAALGVGIDRESQLLRGANGVGNPYLSSLALLRLAPLATEISEIHHLAAVLVDGLSDAEQDWGWEDNSVQGTLRKLTRNRTTLRAAAGLSKAAANNLSVSSGLLGRLEQRAIAFTSPSSGWTLDSPDIACALICMRELNPDLKDSSIYLPTKQGHEMLTQNLRDWEESTKELLRGLSFGRELGLSGYEEAWSIYSKRLAILSGER